MPTDLSLDKVAFLEGRRLTEVAIGRSQVILYFGTDVWISIECALTVGSPDGAVEVWHPTEAFRMGQLFKLFERPITSINLVDEFGLQLMFGAHAAITIAGGDEWPSFEIGHGSDFFKVR